MWHTGSWGHRIQPMWDPTACPTPALVTSCKMLHQAPTWVWPCSGCSVSHSHQHLTPAVGQQQQLALGWGHNSHEGRRERRGQGQTQHHEC